MGCNCGSRRKNFQEATSQSQSNQMIDSRIQDPNINSILSTPDHLLTPRRLRIKQRHIRIEARKARIERRNARNALAEQLKLINQANSSSQNI